jgi:hypothetical protein
MKQYKLKDHVTDEMLVAVGFEIHNPELENTFWLYCATHNRKNIIIPLEACKYGERIIQDEDPNIPPENLDIKVIQDLIELGYVEEMK